MKTLKGSKKEGAKLVETKTWGYHVINYTGTVNVDGEDKQGVMENFNKDLEAAEKRYNELVKK
jgi:hypothetical protein